MIRARSARDGAVRVRPSDGRPALVRPRVVSCAVFVLLAAVAAVGAQSLDASPSQALVEVAPSVRIPRVSRPPSLEDFLERRPREAEASVNGFRQREPRDGQPASQETSAYLSYDDQNLYVVFVCKDDPRRVRAQMAKREDITEDDRVTLYLDSFHDGQRAYVFISNPFGVQRDGVATEGAGTDFRFDTVWRTEGRLTQDGFSVWMAIPFKSLRFPSEAGRSWGIALGRTIAHNNESSYWPYITRRQAGFMRQMATLEGLERISPTHNVQVNPYGSFTGMRLLDPNVPGFASKDQGRWGVDSKLVLRDKAALDITANPDFSQVESDDPQVIVNQRYEVVFPEKRPFFLENAGYFGTPINLFFSRRIADPDFGARLTGRFGRWGVGVLAADDRADGRRIDPSSPLFGDRAAIGVVRVQRDFGTDSRVAALATTRDFGGVQNDVASIDTRFALSPNWYVTAQAAHSYDRDQDGNQLQGDAYSAELLHSGAHFAYNGTYKDFSPHFRSQLGYVRRVDLRRMEHYVGYFWRPEASRLLNFGPGATAGADLDYAGRLQDWWANGDFVVDFSGPAGVRVSRYEAYERYLERGFRYGRTSASFYVNPANWLSIDGSYNGGGAINYAPAGGLEAFLGTAQEASVGFTLRPTTRINLQEYYDYTAFRSPRPTGGAGSSRRIFDNHLMRTKLNFQLTRGLSVRGIIDYYGLFPDSSLVAENRYQHVIGDLLFTWLVHPGTAVYLGYNSRLENMRFDPTRSPNLQYATSTLGLTGRQVFIKMSYLFRL